MDNVLEEGKIDMIDAFYEKGIWYHKPKQCYLENKEIVLVTQPNTDFWQNTNYGYQTDNGHMLLYSFTELEFTFYVKAICQGKELYDQCGIMLYQSSKLWMKASVEKGKDTSLLLGSVVTQNGYSDWAISNNITTNVMQYRISRKQDDFLVEVSIDGNTYQQIRMFHLDNAKEKIQLGIYACSPLESSFVARFSDIHVTSSVWNLEDQI